MNLIEKLEKDVERVNKLTDEIISLMDNKSIRIAISTNDYYLTTPDMFRDQLKEANLKTDIEYRIKLAELIDNLENTHYKIHDIDCRSFSCDDMQIYMKCDDEFYFKNEDDPYIRSIKIKRVDTSIPWKIEDECVKYWKNPVPKVIDEKENYCEW